MTDWATDKAKAVVKQGTTVDSIAQALRDERSRAVELCKTVGIPAKTPDTYQTTRSAGIADARRDIASAIEGE